MSSGSYEAAAEAYLAIMHDDLRALERLLNDVEDVDAPRERERSLLAWACYFNRRSIVDWLLQRGADPNDRDAEGWTPLKHAIHHDDAGLIEKLVVHGADPHSLSRRSKDTCSRPSARRTGAAVGRVARAFETQFLAH